jgi:hypothetical protein
MWKGFGLDIVAIKGPNITLKNASPLITHHNPLIIPQNAAPLPHHPRPPPKIKPTLDRQILPKIPLPHPGQPPLPLEAENLAALLAASALPRPTPPRLKSILKDAGRLHELPRLPDLRLARDRQDHGCPPGLLGIGTGCGRVQCQ